MKIVSISKTVAAVLALTILFLTSCERDDIIRPKDVTAVGGQYSGELNVTGTATKKYSTKFAIGGVGIELGQMPLDEIIPLVIKDSQQAQTALAKTPFGLLKMDYSAVSTESGIINVFATPEQMKFDVLEDGKTKNVNVSFNVTSQPVYSISKKTINFEVQATQISVDGKVVASSPIHFKFVQCKNLSAK
ncbi:MULTISPECIES: DUF4840 domain-containing protein [Chryseobacterium]|uniref:DUF4840 domain-containing protein n=1 Tax=Chryseobacterium camelliae TaxID=1265445 RepID=A0ABU0TDT7_9FLAO|nr:MULTISPECIES: DUF4840 domain-containing protein [Chryseobacterium]MDT3406965.1 hypothetical protein [Pseudacidovorax intermedius]MDQ1095242.1 hypothetical protein [Chryseobacterium camelliae]MDQ1099180.1 hypothetical protein [Chryseobacterium sp. SORGH_AS_1048]MDR6086529.1 hypothetical protein [Chryseobacterium sp. SORGH_AS_0909]MDR6130900.1 hypothetical protein [Chryseobacterium sp. SORGH_AS_1175]